MRGQGAGARGERNERRGVFIQEISNLIRELVKDQFTKMRNFKSPSQ